MRIGARTKIDDLLKEYPFLLDFLAGLSPRFAKLRSPVMRKTVGRVASLNQVAGFGDVPLSELMSKIRAEIKRVTGEDVEVEGGTAPAEPIETQEARLEVLKDIIRELHKGGDLEDQKKRFAELIREISPAEISQLEQKLIAEGMPEEEIKRLCDVHVQVFKESLEGQPPAQESPGHPVRTLTDENRALEKILAEFKTLLDMIMPGDGGITLEKLHDQIQSAIAELGEVEKHYLKKENQLFPVLESKGVSGPSKVMWAIHDDIRLLVKEVRGLLAEGRSAELVTAGRRLVDMMADMIYKEEKILLPLSVETLGEKDWARVKKGEEEIGYAWVKPGSEWTPQVDVDGLPPLPEYKRPAAALKLDTGELTPEQVNLLLKNLPLDVTFVDETDTVRYFSAGAERVFPRSQGVIGRKVQNCHPPDSVHVVERILEAFRKGERQVAEFWIQSRGRFIHIRYFAVRDEAGRYKGCLEVSQDVTSARRLEGERRLLDWK
jgi:PAS domain S-box-containing protein